MNEQINSLLNTNCSPTRSSISSTDRRDSTSALSRTPPSIIIFSSGVNFGSSVDSSYYSTMGRERRATAISTAPFRNRHKDEDDEDEGEPKNVLFGIHKTPAVAIPKSPMAQHSQSFPQSQPSPRLIPRFSDDGIDTNRYTSESL